MLPFLTVFSTFPMSIGSASEFEGPGGALLVVQENGASVAGGAFRHYAPGTAEFKRIWTHSAHRRRGLARLVLAEL